MIHMTPEEKQLWDTCVAFHGHVCAGLLVGFKAAMYAVELLHLDFYGEEELACIAENDTCGVDAIQVVLGCSIGKGNLLFHMTGKQAFSVYNKKTGESVRLALRPIPENGRVERLVYLNGRPAEELFLVTETKIPLPVRNRSFRQTVCSVCGEEVAEHMICVRDGALVCVDCMNEFDRFHL